MAEFLTTHGTSFHLENIIREAKDKLILISPYLQISKTFYERLKDTADRGVKIKIIYGKDELKESDRKKLNDIGSLELYFFENLHAKCYYNESKMLITSMNFYAFSEKNNREMGVLIDRKQDSQLFEKAEEEAASILKSAVLDKDKLAKHSTLKEVVAATTKKAPIESNKGYCLRCQTKIPLNVTKPYCKDCYTKWAEYGNEQYEEKFCHACGDGKPTSMEKPLCFDCYKKMNSFFS